METIKNITGEVRKLADNVEDTRTVTFIASTSSKDRHGTVLNQENWDLKNFNSNPIIGYQHNVYGGDMFNSPNPDDQLGTAKAYYETVKRGSKEERQLLVDITFEPEDINPLADKVFKKVKHGTLRAVSVGFIPINNEEGKEGEERDGAFHYFGQELLEVSVVNIPSNPDALKRSIRESVSSVLTHLTKKLGKRYSEVEEMTVRNVLDILDGKNETLDKDLKEIEGQELIKDKKVSKSRLKYLNLKIIKGLKNE